MGTNNKKFLIRRGTMNTLVVRTDSEGDRLDFLNFKELEGGGVAYVDTSGYELPLRSLLHETPTGTHSLTSVRKTRLAAKMLKVLGETDNFYIVKDDF